MSSPALNAASPAAPAAANFRFIGQVNDARISTMKSLSHFYSLESGRRPDLPGAPDPGLPQRNRVHAEAAIRDARNAVGHLNMALVERLPDMDRAAERAAKDAVKLLQQGMSGLRQGMELGFYLQAEAPLNQALDLILTIPGSSPFRPLPS